MASILAQASRVCTNTSARAVGSVSVFRRSLITSSIKVQSRRYVPSTLRQESSLATASQPSPSSSIPSDPLPSPKDEALNFMNLKDIISPSVLKAITYKPMKLTHMSPVQAEVFPLLPELAEPYDAEASQDRPARDILVKAKTGTGKTLAFLLPAVEARLKFIEAHGKKVVRDAGLTTDHKLEARAKAVFARETVGTLIISPTRELAAQIANEALRLVSHLDGFQVQLFVGGESKRQQMRDWMRGRRDIVVTTPGRLRDLLDSEMEVARAISKTQLLILDEADTLLDMGFRPDIEAIKEFLPPVPERQTFLFSATVSRSIQDIARSTLAPNHRFINCVSAESSPVHANVAQYHTLLPDGSHQIPHILRLLAHDQLSNPGNSKVILFLPTTKMTQLFATTLRELSKTTLPAGRNTQVYEIHSKRTMEQRTRTSSTFRGDKSGASILVTSDVSARGVDYPGVSRVIQVGIPGGTEQYIHRVGRTGRAGTSGRGDLVLLPWEMNFVSSQLTTVPLKPLTASELATQTQELAKKFDQDPTAFFASAPIPPPPPPSRYRRAPPVSGSATFVNPVATTIEDLERTVSEFLVRYDDEDVKETFMSLLGYYVSRSPDLRVSKSEIVDGLKMWAVDAFGLSTPPYVSDSFLTKIGAGGARRGRSQSYSRPRGNSSWSASGPQSGYRGRSQGRDDWAGSSDSGASGSYGGRGGSGSYGGRSERYGGRSDGGYRGRDEGGYKGRGEGEYGGRDGGYGGRNEGGYAERRSGYSGRSSGRGGFRATAESEY